MKSKLLKIAVVGVMCVYSFHLGYVSNEQIIDTKRNIKFVWNGLDSEISLDGDHLLNLYTDEDTVYVSNAKQTIDSSFTIVTATIYHAVPNQTDDTPFVTASNKVINKDNPQGHRWLAVSRDLEKLGYVFGTKVFVEGAGDLDGEWTVEDRMNKRWSKKIDFLVNTTIKGGKWKNVKLNIITSTQH